jgi:1-acyl-sn-glycerol-3-phosphate acyltransferase
MNLIRLTFVVAWTALLGSLGIVVCLLVPGGSLLIPLARLWSRRILTLYRVRTRAVFDPELSPGQPCVYVSNHQSQFDIPALVVAMPTDFRIVAKRELLYIPIFGWALWLAGFIFIDRSDRERAIRRLERTVRTIRRGTSVVVFAEGTRSVDGRLLPFKKGGFVLALQAGVPIVPVSIRGGGTVLPKGSLRVRPGTIEVRFGAPIPTTGYSLDTKDSLIALVRDRIGAGLAATTDGVGDLPA